MQPVKATSYNRIGLIGDVHAEDNRLELAITTLQSAGAEVLLCTGDLTDGTGDLARCCELIREHQVLCVRGNHDRWVLDDRVRHIDNAHQRDSLCAATLATLQSLPTQRRLTTAQGELLLCHGVLDNDLGKVWPGSERMPPERNAKLDALIAQGPFRWFINGHMHYRVLVDFPGLTLINAGTLNPRHRPGVTLLDMLDNQIHVFEFDLPTDSTGTISDAETHSLTLTKTVALADPNRPQWTNSQHFNGDRAPHTLY